MAKQKFRITNWSAYNKALRQRRLSRYGLMSQPLLHGLTVHNVKVVVDRFTTPIGPDDEARV